MRSAESKGRRVRVLAPGPRDALAGCSRGAPGTLPGPALTPQDPSPTSHGAHPLRGTPSPLARGSCSPAGGLEGGTVLPYNEDGAGDGDPSHEAMGDGVRLVGVADGVVIAVEAPFVRGVHQRQDDEGQRCCKAERGRGLGYPGLQAPRRHPACMVSPSHIPPDPAPHCWGRILRLGQHAGPAADRVLSELAAACSTQIPQPVAALRHPQSSCSSSGCRPRADDAPAPHAPRDVPAKEVTAS